MFITYFLYDLVRLSIEFLDLSLCLILRCFIFIKEADICYFQDSSTYFKSTILENVHKTFRL